MGAPVKVEIHSELPHDKVAQIDVDDVLAFLNADPPSEVVDQLYDFGKLLLDQIRGLRNSYESKLSSCLGWGTATLAILLSGLAKWLSQDVAGILASAGALFAFLSVAVAIVGLKSFGGWKWPSEKDWFQPEYLRWAAHLKRHHLVSMLEAHQSYSLRTQRKGYALMIAEYLLAASALCLGVAVVIHQVF